MPTTLQTSPHLGDRLPYLCQCAMLDDVVADNCAVLAPVNWQKDATQTQEMSPKSPGNVAVKKDLA